MSSFPAGHPRHRLGTATAVVAGLALLHFGSIGGLPALADDVWRYREQSEAMIDGEKRGVVLDEQFAAVVARIEFRTALSRRLAAGTLSLQEAVSQYRAFIGHDPRFDDALMFVAEGADAAERVSNYLLKAMTRANEVDASTRRRLTAEFRATFGRDPTDAPRP